MMLTVLISTIAASVVMVYSGDQCSDLVRVTYKRTPTCIPKECDAENGFSTKVICPSEDPSAHVKSKTNGFVVNTRYSETDCLGNITEITAIKPNACVYRSKLVKIEMTLDPLLTHKETYDLIGYEGDGCTGKKLSADRMGTMQECRAAGIPSTFAIYNSAITAFPFLAIALIIAQ
jgi:hypothetical protein